MEYDQMRFIWGSAEKFFSWPRYSHGICPNLVYTRVIWNLLDDLDTLMEYNQMCFFFQNNSSCGLHTSFIGVAVLGSHG